MSEPENLTQEEKIEAANTGLDAIMDKYEGRKAAFIVIAAENDTLDCAVASTCGSDQRRVMWHLSRVLNTLLVNDQVPKNDPVN